MQGGNQLIVSICQRMYKIRFYKHFFLFYGDKIIFLSPHFLQILLFLCIFN